MLGNTICWLVYSRPVLLQLLFYSYLQSSLHSVPGHLSFPVQYFCWYIRFSTLFPSSSEVDSPSWLVLVFDISNYFFLCILLQGGHRPGKPGIIREFNATWKYHRNIREFNFVIYFKEISNNFFKYLRFFFSSETYH